MPSYSYPPWWLAGRKGTSGQCSIHSWNYFWNFFFFFPLRRDTSRRIEKDDLGTQKCHSRFFFVVGGGRHRESVCVRPLSPCGVSSCAAISRLVPSLKDGRLPAEPPSKVVNISSRLSRNEKRWSVWDAWRLSKKKKKILSQLFHDHFSIFAYFVCVEHEGIINARRGASSTVVAVVFVSCSIANATASPSVRWKTQRRRETLRRCGTERENRHVTRRAEPFTRVWEKRVDSTKEKTTKKAKGEKKEKKIRIKEKPS